MVISAIGQEDRGVLATCQDVRGVIAIGKNRLRSRKTCYLVFPKDDVTRRMCLELDLEHVEIG